jgi:hypothetical protein
MITEEEREQLNEWFRYHSPTKEQQEALDRLNAAALELCKAIMETTTPCADRSAAVRQVREAKMTAAAAIVSPAFRRTSARHEGE